MTGYELAEWAAFERLYGPILIHERVDAAQAMLSAVLARVMGGSKDAKPADFLPRWDGSPRQSEDEIIGLLTSMKKPKEE